MPLRLLPLLLAAALLPVACVSTPAGPEELAEAGEREPGPAAMHATARLYAAQGRQGEAEWLLRRVLAESPAFAPAWEELARLYVTRDLVDSAVVTLELGLQAVPGDPVLLNDLGMCHLLRRDLEPALQAFVAAAAAAAPDARPRANLAVTLALLGRDEEALAVWEQVLPPAEAQRNLELVAAAR